MKTHLLVLLMVLAAPLAAQSKKKIDFAKDVFPILDRNCTECHRATYTDENGRKRRPKGRVMLDTLANIKKSKRGKLFVAKKPDDSIIMESITLPAEDEDRMPPPKKGPPLSKTQVDLIKRWIEEGADFGAWTGEAAAPKEDSGKPLKPKRKNAKRTKNIHTLTDKQKLAKGIALEPTPMEFDVEMQEAELKKRLFEEARLNQQRERQFPKGRRLTGRKKVDPEAQQRRNFWH